MSSQNIAINFDIFIPIINIVLVTTDTFPTFAN
jgi:hypothetical protein